MLQESEPDAREADLPEHVENSVEEIARLRAEHMRGVSRYQLTINAITARVGSPTGLVWISAFIACWIGANLALTGLHLQPFDRPPFSWLQGIVTTSALFVTVLILTTQRHENELAEHRAQFTLQLALVAERKTAKLLQRSEEHRRLDPHVETSEDPEASAMAAPVDARAMSSAIRASISDADKVVE